MASPRGIKVNLVTLFQMGSHFSPQELPKPIARQGGINTHPSFREMGGGKERLNHGQVVYDRGDSLKGYSRMGDIAELVAYYLQRKGDRVTALFIESWQGKVRKRKVELRLHEKHEAGGTSNVKRDRLIGQLKSLSPDQRVGVIVWINPPNRKISSIEGEACTANIVVFLDPEKLPGDQNKQFEKPLALNIGRVRGELFLYGLEKVEQERLAAALAASSPVAA